MYKKYCVLIVSKFLQNTCSDSKFNQKFDYEFGMQGLIQRYFDLKKFENTLSNVITVQ